MHPDTSDVHAARAAGKALESLENPTLADIAEHVPPLILRDARHAAVLHLAVRAVDISDAVAIARRILDERAAEAKEYGARAVRRVARLDAWQQCGVADVAQRRVARCRSRRLLRQRRRGNRERLLWLWRLLLWIWWLGKFTAPWERDGAEPAAIGRLAVCAGLQGRVGVAATCGSEQTCGEVGEVADERRSEVVGQV